MKCLILFIAVCYKLDHFYIITVWISLYRTKYVTTTEQDREERQINLTDINLCLKQDFLGKVKHFIIYWEIQASLHNSFVGH